MIPRGIFVPRDSRSGPGSQDITRIIQGVVQGLYRGYSAYIGLRDITLTDHEEGSKNEAFLGGPRIRFILIFGESIFGSCWYVLFRETTFWRINNQQVLRKSGIYAGGDCNALDSQSHRPHQPHPSQHVKTTVLRQRDNCVVKGRLPWVGISTQCRRRMTFPP